MCAKFRFDQTSLNPVSRGSKFRHETVLLQIADFLICNPVCKQMCDGTGVGTIDHRYLIDNLLILNNISIISLRYL